MNATASGSTGGWVSWPCEWCSRSVALVVMRSPRKSRAAAITVSTASGIGVTSGMTSAGLRQCGQTGKLSLLRGTNQRVRLTFASSMSSLARPSRTALIMNMPKRPAWSNVVFGGNTSS